MTPGMTKKYNPRRKTGADPRKALSRGKSIFASTCPVPFSRNYSSDYRQNHYALRNRHLLGGRQPPPVFFARPKCRKVAERSCRFLHFHYATFTLREFLYMDDLANLCVFLMNNYSGNETVNAGTGKELTIKELTELVAKVVGYQGTIEWDTTKPNGTPMRLHLVPHRRHRPGRRHPGPEHPRRYRQAAGR